MSPWALQGAGITPGEHHCLILHLLSLKRLSIGDPASSPSRELISTQLLLPSSTQVLVAATHDCQDACVCVSGGPFDPQKHHSYFLHISYAPLSPETQGSPPTQVQLQTTEEAGPPSPVFLYFFWGHRAVGGPGLCQAHFLQHRPQVNVTLTGRREISNCIFRVLRIYVLC